MTSQPILVDANVLMDVLARREPHFTASAAVWAAVEKRGVEGWASADSFTTLYYLLRKRSGSAMAHRCLQLVSEVFKIVPVDAALLEKALHSPLDDFEDAVQYECALRVKAATIITRDMYHFQNTSIPAMTPAEFVAKFNLA